MYALNLAADSRILSVCTVLSIGSYDGMPIVNTLPDDDVTDYKYIDGKYVYDPLPKPEESEAQPTLEERVEQTEADIEYIAMMTGIDMEV